MTKKEFIKLIKKYGDSAVRVSWAGGGHVEDIRKVLSEHDNVYTALTGAYDKIKSDK